MQQPMIWQGRTEVIEESRLCLGESKLCWVWVVPGSFDRNRTAADTATGLSVHPNPFVHDLSEGAAVDAWLGEYQRHDKQKFNEGGARWKKQEFRLEAHSRI